MWKHCARALMLVLAFASHGAAAQTISLSELTSYSVRLKRFVVEGSLSESERQKIIGEVEAEPIGADTMEQALREVSDKVRFAFQDRGYFKAVVGDASLLASSGDSHQLDVSVKVADTGVLYRLKGITFTNAPELSSNELRAVFPIHDGDIVSRKPLAKGLENMRHLYGKRGYLFFTSVPDIKLDEQAKTIALNVDADAGPVFHVGELIVDGEESVPGGRNRLLEAWKPFEGQVCDVERVTTEFLRKIGAKDNVRAEEVFRIDEMPATHSANFRIRLVNPFD